jgi:predicted nucleotidyltransferase
MDKTSVEAIVKSLNQHQVQYLIVGGLAVVAHGYVRYTADVDLMLAVDEQNLKRAVEAIKSLDYRPRAPVAFEEFIDPANRQRWAAEKHMKVFSLYSTKYSATEIDLFLEPPIDFDASHANAVRLEISPGLSVLVCSLDDLIKMKSMAGRARDINDIVQLKKLRKTN